MKRLLIGFSVGAIIIGVLLGTILFWRFYAVNEKGEDNRLELITITTAIMGVLPLGGKVAIQLQKNEREEDKHFREQLSLAIEHLGHDELTIRKGALHELYRLAKDSERDCPTVVYIIRDYIREKMETFATVRAEAKELEDSQGKKLENRPDEGVFLASMFLKKFVEEKLGDEEDLDVQAKLKEAELAGADLENIFLRKAELSKAKLQHGELKGANLESATLWGADLKGANLESTNLGSANLTGVNLTEANLGEANLKNAFFYHADLRGVLNLTVDQLRDAHYDDTTLLDPEFCAELDKIKGETT